MSYYRQSRHADRFDNYREITARFASTGACGHEIKKGEVVGYHPSRKTCQCAQCWERWVRENRAADSYEAYGSDCMFDY